MSQRSTSPHEMFLALAREHRPLLRFAAADPEGFRRWKSEALPRVFACLGDAPPAVPPRPALVAEWTHDGLRKQRWRLAVGPHIDAFLQVNVPADLLPGERRRAILCCHGHGPYGKEAVMGNASSPGLRADVQDHNYAYGHAMAKAGFVTFAIDWMGFGERADGSRPHSYALAEDGGKDWCDLYYLSATMLGMTPLGMNCSQGRVAVDHACSLPFVDPSRLGVMGLSGGGTMALWMALTDERLRAVEIICYSSLWQDFGYRDAAWCGMQVAPGLLKLVDVPDLQGLLAPRPLLVDIAVHDTTFLLDSAMACHEQVKRIYETAGCGSALELDLFPGEHGWGGNRSVEFFRERLA